MHAHAAAESVVWGGVIGHATAFVCAYVCQCVCHLLFAMSLKRAFSLPAHGAPALPPPASKRAKAATHATALAETERAAAAQAAAAKEEAQAVARASAERAFAAHLSTLAETWGYAPKSDEEVAEAMRVLGDSLCVAQSEITVPLGVASTAMQAAAAAERSAVVHKLRSDAVYMERVHGAAAGDMYAPHASRAHVTIAFQRRMKPALTGAVYCFVDLVLQRATAALAKSGKPRAAAILRLSELEAAPSMPWHDTEVCPAGLPFGLYTTPARDVKMVVCEGRNALFVSVYSLALWFLEGAGAFVGHHAECPVDDDTLLFSRFGSAWDSIFLDEITDKDSALPLMRVHRM